MNTNNKDLQMSGAMFFELMFLMFLGLKISGLIDWSWWWIFAPIWVPIAILLGILGILALFLIISKAMEKNKGAQTNKK